MKVNAWVDLSRQVEVNIDAEQIRVALEEAFAAAKLPNAFDQVNAPTVMLAFAGIGSFLSGFSDELIGRLNDKQRSVIANFLQTQVDRFKAVSGKSTLPAETQPPRRIRLLNEVRSDLPFGPRLIAPARVYESSEIVVNAYGAVSVITPTGVLGIKPDEFEWI